MAPRHGDIRHWTLWTGKVLLAALLLLAAPAAAEPEPASEPQPVVAPAARPAPIWLHVASFRDSLRANRYQGLLRQAGTPSQLRRVVLTDGEPWHRVLIGPYTVADAAEAEAGRLESTGLISFHRLLSE